MRIALPHPRRVKNNKNRRLYGLAYTYATTRSSTYIYYRVVPRSILPLGADSFSTVLVYIEALALDRNLRKRGTTCQYFPWHIRVAGCVRTYPDGA